MLSSPRNRYVLTATLAYLLLALVWIFLSDRLLAVFIDASSLSWWPTVKSEFASIVSAALFLIALRRVPSVHAENRKGALHAWSDRNAWSTRPRWLAYLGAVVITLGMLAVRQMLSISFGERPLLILFMFPIILSALIGGLGPGLLATLVAALGVLNLAILPTHDFKVIAGYDIFQLAFLIVNGGVVSLLSEFLRKTRARAAMHRNLLDAVVSGTSDLIFVKDTHGRYLLANPAVAALLGKPIAAIIGQDDQHVFPQAAQALMARDQAMIARGGVQTFEERVVTASGKDMVFLVTKGPVLDQAGRIYGVFGISRDITERKQAEIMLRNSDEAMKEAQHLAGIGSWRWHIKTDEHIWSDQVYRIYGRDRALSPAVYPEVESYFEHESWRKLSAAVEKCLAYGGEYECDAEVTRPDGVHRWITVRGAAKFNAAGEMEELHGTIQDITERKQAEEALHQIDANFRSMLDSMLEGCQVVDFDWRYRYINDAAQAQNRRPSEEILGRIVTDCWPGFSKTEIFAVEKKCMEERTVQRSEFEFIYPDGQKKWFRVIIQPVREGIAIFSEDISARKEAEVALRIAAAAFDSQEGMMVTDAGGVILRVNRAFTEITGYEAEEAVGQTLNFFQSGRQDALFYQEMWDVLHASGHWNGEIWDRRKNGEVYPKWLSISAVKDSHGMVTNYIGTHYDITERKSIEDKIVSLAFFDPLTGLPNRTLLMDRLKQAVTASSRSNNYGALLFIDLDNFKTLNDTLGHHMGDLLLKQVAQRLTACMREGDTVARVSGDEFVAILPGTSATKSDAIASTEAVTKKILTMLRPVYYIDEHPYQNTVSIGATLFDGRAANVDELLKQADLAMYRAKEAGRNTFCFFDPAMQTVVIERVALESDLRQAIESEQFVLYYQPQVVNGGGVTGAEVLVRWQHPQRGLVSPIEFIPLAEETGLILPLGHWILHTACSQLAKWAKQPEMAHLTIAVNVSARQFGQPDFVEQVLAVIRSSGADVTKLKLELTESLLVDNVQDTIEKMFALKAKGVGFSLDDFGTGYSSLSYLKKLPLDQLKIDRSFVRDVLIDPNDAAIAKTIVALAQSLGLGVIAEGVETEAQQEFLAKSGCHCYQGFLFSRPVPVDDFEKLVHRI